MVLIKDFSKLPRIRVQNNKNKKYNYFKVSNPTRSYLTHFGFFVIYYLIIIDSWYQLLYLSLILLPTQTEF